jgi:hypothetical protein
MNADTVYKNCLEGWGNKKKLYNVSFSEMEVLLLDLSAKIVVVDCDNHDGTFYTEVLYLQKKFAVSSSKKIKNG